MVSSCVPFSRIHCLLLGPALLEAFRYVLKEVLARLYHSEWHVLLLSYSLSGVGTDSARTGERNLIHDLMISRWAPHQTGPPNIGGTLAVHDLPQPQPQPKT